MFRILSTRISNSVFSQATTPAFTTASLIQLAAYSSTEPPAAGGMTAIMFSPSASPCSSSNLKRKRDEFGAVMSMNSCSSLADHGQACPPTAGMGTLNLRGEIHSRTIKRTRNKPKEREVHGRRKYDGLITSGEKHAD